MSTPHSFPELSLCAGTPPAEGEGRTLWAQTVGLLLRGDTRAVGRCWHGWLTNAHVLGDHQAHQVKHRRVLLTGAGRLRRYTGHAACIDGRRSAGQAGRAARGCFPGEGNRKMARTQARG